MTYYFQLPEIPGSNFTLVKSIWTGKSALFKDQIPVQKLTEKGKPFLIPRSDGSFLKAFTKLTLPDFVPAIEINGTLHYIVKKLKWYQYLIGGLPILLLFIGGALGGIIGAIATILNFIVFRQPGSQILKYFTVIGIVLVSYALYFYITILIINWID